MSIKILGGLAKGRSLLVPKGQLIRPTSVLLKRRLFDSIQDFSDYEFYDICAGSGAMALEAWSRGAQKCFLLEKNRSVYSLMVKNVAMLQEKFPSESKMRVIGSQNGAMEKWLGRTQDCFKNERAIIFVDPPYEKHNLYKDYTLKILKDESVQAQIWIESDKDKGLPLEYWQDQGVSPYKVYKQGGSYIALFKR